MTDAPSRINEIGAEADRLAGERDRWIDRNLYFHQSDWDYLSLMVPQGASVLEIGCGTGRLLAALKPGRGVGIDVSANMVARARAANPEMSFHVGDAQAAETFRDCQGPFDFVILSDVIGFLDDFQAVLDNVRRVSDERTRIVIAFYSLLWRPVVRIAGDLSLMMPAPRRNWLSMRDIAGIVELADFEVVRTDTRQLLPLRLFGLGPLVNHTLGRLPLLRSLGIRNYTVARIPPREPLALKSISVVIPARNEKGNIEPAVQRMPAVCDDVEIIFVEGHSRDGTLDEINRVIAAYPDRDIKCFVQQGVGKGDAVRLGFAKARGDVLVIQDADLTAPPEMLPRFFEVLNSGKAEFANGTRLVYPMDADAMRTLNFLANHTFAWILSWLIGQRITDSLCGTKALLRRDYQEIERGRAYFGDVDPFGDFDLIFGCAKRNMKFLDIPLRYYGRSYGTTQISRFRHGWQLLKMVVLAWRKLVRG